MFRRGFLIFLLVLVLASCIDKRVDNKDVATTITASSSTTTQILLKKLKLKTIDANVQNAFKENADYLVVVDGGVLKSNIYDNWWEGESLYIIDKKTNVSKKIYTGKMIDIVLIDDEKIDFSDSTYQENAEYNPSVQYIYDFKYGKVHIAEQHEGDFIYKGNIYFSEWSVDGGPILNVFVKSNKGSNIIKIFNRVKWYQMLGRYIVYETTTDINIFNMDTNKNRKVVSYEENLTDSRFSELSNGYIVYFGRQYPHTSGTAFNIEKVETIPKMPGGLSDENAFYYLDDRDRKIVYRFDGVDRKLLIRNYADNLSIIGDFVYFTAVENNMRVCYRFRKDGTGIEKVIK